MNSLLVRDSVNSVNSLILYDSVSSVNLVIVCDSVNFVNSLVVCDSVNSVNSLIVCDSVSSVNQFQQKPQSCSAISAASQSKPCPAAESQDMLSLSSFAVNQRQEGSERKEQNSPSQFQRGADVSAAVPDLSSCL